MCGSVARSGSIENQQAEFGGWTLSVTEVKDKEGKSEDWLMTMEQATFIIYFK